MNQIGEIDKVIKLDTQDSSPKTHNETEKKAADVAKNLNVIYAKDPLKGNDDITEISELYEKEERQNLLKKKVKRFSDVVTELAQNIRDHSIRRYPKLSIEKDENMLHIKTENYFDGGPEQKAKLEESLDQLNKYSAEEIQEKYLEVMNDGNQEKKGRSGANLGFLRIAKKLKKMVKGDIFNYKIEEEKDEENKKIYKLNLDIDFPIAA